ncbi:hypothetical protein [Rhizobium sp. MHM7A]|uniref:hypothetical protein n=1 Tax=Rhizobium sp. MHM7A TaxID=2583233 RepID=UPI00110630CF|nr:hypothetical protein [Rhizobium sp. MHM7A]TLX17140.1 hypothetical protein FFR93_07465 [Rhizobium sp. MHM7A]
MTTTIQVEATARARSTILKSFGERIRKIIRPPMRFGNRDRTRVNVAAEIMQSDNGRKLRSYYMLATAINFEGATRDGAQHINHHLETANKKVRELLENAVRANHESVRFLILRDGKWFSTNWKKRQYYYKFMKFDKVGRFGEAVFNSIACGLAVPIVAVVAFKEQGLGYLASLIHYSVLPTFAAVTTFCFTNAYRDWKDLKAEHKKFGYAFEFMKDIPQDLLHRGWAATEQALYMLEIGKDKDEPVVKRLPWSEILASIYVNEDEFEGIRLLDGKGEYIQGINSPREDKGAAMPMVAAYIRSKIAEQAIGMP